MALYDQDQVYESSVWNWTDKQLQLLMSNLPGVPFTMLFSGHVLEDA